MRKVKSIVLDTVLHRIVSIPAFEFVSVLLHCQIVKNIRVKLRIASLKFNCALSTC